jgi:hypothetical protein
MTSLQGISEIISQQDNAIARIGNPIGPLGESEQKRATAYIAMIT